MFKTWPYSAPQLQIHWLKVPERISVPTVCTAVCAAQHHLTETTRPVSSHATRHSRSADTSTVLVPSMRRSTIGDRAFSVAAARTWNSLPANVRNACFSIFLISCYY